MSLKLFLERMEHIVHVERRLFSHRDFLSFHHKGKSHKFSPGTIRNYFSELRNQGQIELVYRTTVAFHTLNGVKIGKTMTPYHTGGTSITTDTPFPTNTRKGPHVNSSGPLNYKQHRFLQFLLTIPMDIDGIHNVRLKFAAKGLWEILPMYNDFNYLIKKMDTLHNKNIVLHDLKFGDHIIKATSHRTGTVSVTVSCSKIQYL